MFTLQKYDFFLIQRVSGWLFNIYRSALIGLFKKSW